VRILFPVLVLTCCKASGGFAIKHGHIRTRVMKAAQQLWNALDNLPDYKSVGNGNHRFIANAAGFSLRRRSRELPVTQTKELVISSGQT